MSEPDVLLDIWRGDGLHESKKYQELEQMDGDYQHFMLSVRSATEIPAAENLERERHDVEEKGEDDDLIDPHMQLFMNRLKVHGKSYAIEHEKNGEYFFIKYERSSSENEDEPEPQSKRRRSIRLQNRLSSHKPCTENNGVNKDEEKHALPPKRPKVQRHRKTGIAAEWNLSLETDNKLSGLEPVMEDQRERETWNKTSSSAQQENMLPSLELVIENNSMVHKLINPNEEAVIEKKGKKKCFENLRTLVKKENIDEKDDDKEVEKSFQNLRSVVKKENTDEKDDDKEGKKKSFETLKNVVNRENTDENDDHKEGMKKSFEKVKKDTMDEKDDDKEGKKKSSENLKNVVKKEITNEKDDDEKNAEEKVNNQTSGEVELLDKGGNLGGIVPSRIFDISMFEDAQVVHAVVRSDFRKQVTSILRKPYSRKEYDKLRALVKAGKYLNHYPCIRKMLITYYHQHDRRKNLNILRGFFFWLKHLTTEDSFQPWEDAECMEVMQENPHVPLPRKRNHNIK